MLNKLVLHNFESHRDTVLELGPGINTVTGTSDSGKSSLIRGIKWVWKNRPRGISIMRFGKKNTSVSLSCQGDRLPSIVTRSRSSKFNGYEIHKGGRKIFDAEALRGDVPQEVEDCLGLSDITFQCQLDPYFLVLDPPSKVGQFFRRLGHIEKIDAVVSDLASKLRKATTRSGFVKEELVKLKERFGILQDLPLVKMVSLLNSAKLIDGRMDIAKQKSFDLEDLIESLKSVEGKIKGTPKELRGILKDGDSCLIRLRKKQEQLDTLSDLIDSLRGLRKTRKKVGVDLAALETHMDVILKDLKVCPMCGKKVDSKFIAKLKGL